MLEKVGQYHIVEVIGSGSWSKVFRAIDTDTGMEVAIKRVERINTNSDFVDMEVSIMKKSSHMSIPKLYNTIEDEKYYYIVMELIIGETIANRVAKDGKLNESLARTYFVQIISVLTYLHEECGVSHGDIKAENFLVRDDDSVAILDFGFSCFLRCPQKEGVINGSPYYMPPEIVMREPSSDLSDIWSTGVFLYYIVTGEFPFESDDFQGLLRTILKMKPIIPKDISPSLADLIKKMLVKDRSQRISLEEIRQHPWYLGNSEDSFILSKASISSVQSFGSLNTVTSMRPTQMPSPIAKPSIVFTSHRLSDIDMDTIRMSPFICDSNSENLIMGTKDKLSRSGSQTNPRHVEARKMSDKRAVPVLARRTITLPRRVSKPL